MADTSRADNRPMCAGMKRKSRALGELACQQPQNEVTASPGKPSASNFGPFWPGPVGSNYRAG